MRRTAVLAGAVVACLLAAGVLLASDVNVSGGRGGEDWYCGPAFKAVRGDTYGGGEMPANLTALDAACADKAEKYLWAAAVAGTTAAVLLVPVGLNARRRRRAAREHREGPAQLPLR